MNAPLVSIVIPFFNAERYLAESVASALGQSWPHLEILLVDDGSTDASPRIAAQWAAADRRVRFLRGENGGPSRARNRGILASRGEIVAFLDADDLWTPDKLERQIPLFETVPPAHVVYSQRLTIDAEGRRVEGYQPPVHNGHILQELWIDNFICMSSAVVRRDLFDRIGYFDENLRMSEDFDFWLRVAAASCTFRGVGEPLVKYRTHGEQTSCRTQERVRVAWEIRARFDARYGNIVHRRSRLRARGRHYATRALRDEGAGERWSSLGNYLCALAYDPLNQLALRGLVKGLLPGAVISRVRQIVKTPLKAGSP